MFNSIRTNRDFILSFVDSHIIDYPTPINLNYLWSFGSAAGICLVIQIITGILLAMHYTPHIEFAFNSVEHIMRDVNNGWLIRYLHANGASMFFIVVYCYIFRGLYYGSYMFPREKLWLSWAVIFFDGLKNSFRWYVMQLYVKLIVSFFWKFFFTFLLYFVVNQICFDFFLTDCSGSSIGIKRKLDTNEAAEIPLYFTNKVLVEFVKHYHSFAEAEDQNNFENLYAIFPEGSNSSDLLQKNKTIISNRGIFSNRGEVNRILELDGHTMNNLLMEKWCNSNEFFKDHVGPLVLDIRPTFGSIILPPRSVYKYVVLNQRFENFSMSYETIPVNESEITFTSRHPKDLGLRYNKIDCPISQNWESNLYFFKKHLPPKNVRPA